MGYSVNRHSQPERKLAQFEGRIATLQGAVKAGKGATRVGHAAEKLRLAALAVVKAKLALIREYPQRDPDGRHAANLRDEERRWRALSIGAIVAEHGGTPGPRGPQIIGPRDGY